MTYDWPVLRRYDEAHQLRVAMPIGGIATGTVGLGGRGDLRDWEIGNRPAKGETPRFSFFAVRCEDPNGNVAARALEGPIDPVLYEGPHGAAVPQHSLPRFRHSDFLAAYPLGQVELSDPEVPVRVRLQAFNPLIPTDADASGIPVAVLRYLVTNSTGLRLDVSVAGSVEAPPEDAFETAGTNGVDGTTSANGPIGVQAKSGRLALAALGEYGDDITRRTRWAGSHWGFDLLDFWDDFADDGRLDERPAETDRQIASIAVRRSLPPGETRAFTFVLTWRFDDRLDWKGESTVGNYYATEYADAWQVVTDTAPRLAELERRTVEFVRAVCDSDLPDVAKEAALFNVSTLRSQTCFRTPDGEFFGWEGCNNDSGSCHGNCVHVWNYEHASPYLFGAMARSMRRTEFLHGTDDNGHMSFRIQLPLERGHSSKGDGVAAADGQMGALVKLYREWKLSGDDTLLAELWPRARKALEFAWVPGGWDPDRDGVMEGSQHNTMDVEYFGPNPEIGVWYLAALRACAEMAAHQRDDELAATCRDLLERGSTWLDAELFNGEYYRHEIRPPGAEDSIAPGLRLPGVGARDLDDPEFQVGDGCLSGQLVGQTLAHLTGLGHLLDPAHVETTLRSITRLNHVDGVWGHFNPLRSYALGDEKGLIVGSYRLGNRPVRPFPYYAEVWAGLEYTAAIGMVYEGLVDEALAVVADTRDRYDGRKRNPFNETECGFHYVRSMAAWGLIPALTGFSYDGASGRLEVRAADEQTTWFWSNGWAYGRITQTPEDDAYVELEVLGGHLRLSTLALGDGRKAELGEQVLEAGDRLGVTVG